MFGDSDGSKDPGASALASDPAFPNSELTLSSNLCDKPTLASAAAAEAAAPGSSSPPNPAADAADAANAKLCVEFDFLHLYAAERGDPPGDDSSVVGGKKPRLDSLQLSLSPPSDGPGQPSSHPQTQLPSASAADGDLRGASAGAAAAPPPSWTCSATTGRTRSINSHDMFSHNATDICAAGEGTNGSVHSRFSFCPMADGSVAFPTPPLKGGTSSFFPTELPAKMAAAAAAASAGGSFDGGRGGYTSRPDRILREVVSDSVSAMAHVLQDFPSEALEVLREAARSMVDTLEKRDELASLQRTLERRSDLTAEALARANRTQLEILVAIKTGTAVFVTGKGRVPSSELVEMFLMTRCRNVNCKTMLPVDDCDCKICSSNKGFCGGCMCMVCHKFDCAPNTCSWVGCDVCGHWCHAACGLERNLIRPGPTLKGPIRTIEMQFQCLACSHSSEMFGFVKEVFSGCAENWNADTLVKELDFVRKIFAASDDFEGKGLHAKAEEVLSMLSKKVISMLDATNIMLQFFKCETTSPTRVQSGYAMFDAQAAAAAAGPSSPTNLADAADEANAKPCIELDFLHLFAKMTLAAAAAASVGKSRPDRILLEFVSNFVSTMAHVLQDFPSESLSLERLREKVRNIVDALEKRDELASLQRRLEHRSDLTAEALGQANRTQLEILVAMETGTAAFVTGKDRIPSSELVEMLLMTRCRNWYCKRMLPANDCECKICSSNKGFCGECMCMVCHKFDSAANTCSWVGCDVCGHWCHAACALERNLISPGPTLRGPIGTTEMQFQCLSCSYSSEMFEFVKEVFNCCAEKWNVDTLMKELDLARKVFAASDDFEEKGLHAQAEEVLSMYANRVISLLAATNIMLQFFKYSTKNKGGLQHPSLMPRKFPLQLLEHITYNFSKERIIGRGTYGVVYKGVLDGEEIAVKKLYSLPGLGDDQFKECINLTRVQHQNIVRLVGYCYETQHEVVEYDGEPVLSIIKEERALCLEYLQGGSLDQHISEAPCGLDWSICYGIIKGICEGLKYLHTGSKNPICHLDLKPGNILLDMDMIPKIGDFGLSRLIGSAETCVAQNLIGTFGYMPPEYIDKQEITPKFDVFSLGVIIIQIMAGRTGCFQRADMPPQEFIEHVHGKWERRLQATMSSDTSLEVNTCTEIALRCVEDDPLKRPTIAEIVDKLNTIHTTKSSSTLEE